MNEDFSDEINMGDAPKFKATDKDPATKVIKAAMSDIKSTDDVEDAILAGTLRLLVPMDARVSPWPVAKLFELSKAQAEMFIGALRSMSAAERKCIEYVVRKDGTVAVRRTNAEAYHHGVPAVGTATLQGVRACEPGREFDANGLHATGHA